MRQLQNREWPNNPNQSGSLLQNYGYKVTERILNASFQRGGTKLNCKFKKYRYNY